MIELLLRDYCCRGKALSITYSECVFVALVTQHSKRMRRVHCHLWPVRLDYIFSTLSHNDIRKKGTENKICI